MTIKDTPTSAWATNKKYAWASRGEGLLTLVSHRGVFLLLSDKVEPLQAETLDSAIGKADTLHPPEGWSHVVGLWLHRGWKVQPVEDGWAVFDEQGTRKSKQVFTRADLARKWCEIRADRVGLNLRGPKPGARTEPSGEPE